jgi:endonuclease YncB( thermonuclease family)
MNLQDLEIQVPKLDERFLLRPRLVTQGCLIRSALALVLLAVPALLVALAPSTPSTQQENAGPSAQQKKSRPSAQQEKKCFTGAKAHRVVRVIDPDTVVLSIDGKETTVGLLGAWAGYKNDWRFEPTTREATQLLERLLRGESVYLEEVPCKAHTHKPGCTMAYVYRASDELFVNREIVRRGYASCPNYDHKYKDLFRQCESEAIKFGRGMYAFD